MTDRQLGRAQLCSPDPAWLTLEHMSPFSAVRDSILVLGCVLCSWLVARTVYFEWALRAPGSELFAWFIPNIALAFLAMGLALTLTWPLERSLRLRAHEGRVRRECVLGIAGALLYFTALLIWTGAWRLLEVVDAAFGLGISDNAGVSEQRGVQAWEAVPWGTSLLIAGGAVIPEEVLFRGLLLPRLRRITGRWWSAILINSMLFGLWHINGGWAFVASVAFLSIASCVVLIATRSLLSAIVAHLVYNCGQFVLSQYLWRT